MIDLDALDAAIAESERRNMFTAPIVKDLMTELREARGERAAVVAWLRAEAEAAAQTYTVQAGEWANRTDAQANAIERGEHRREVTDAHR